MRRPILLFTLVWTAILAGSSAQEPRVRASLQTKDAIWVGQRVTFVVELLAPGFFSGAPAFDLPDPPGILLVPPVGSPIVGSEEIDGRSYTVQRYELFVFARRAGVMTVPSITVRFHFKRQPLDKDNTAATVKTLEFTLTTKTPPGAEKLGGIIAARNLTATESWLPETEKAKVGDAFTRTIVFAAPDVPAIAFPPFPYGQIDGIGIYEKPPEVLDHNDRSALRGERRDALTYVCQRPGRFVIPAVRFTWWDLDAQQLRVADFPARNFDVLPNPAMASAATDATKSRRGLPSDELAAILVLLAGLLAYGFVLIRAHWARWSAPWRPVRLAPLNPNCL